ncbi:CDP-glycerol glycerophosphotransferase family protein [Aeromonas veronii]|uniref:CDP-glycerol glycerophosphotransferase family protein n=1 Tax=Aeromonas veronii TaxID=654 RepID=UPI003F79F614
MKVGFIVWNKFQIKVFEKLINIFEDATIVIENRPANTDMFSLDYLRKIKCNFVFVDKNKMSNLDGVFDVLFCQTIFSQIEHIKSSKIAMLQYGLAKENHNYGAWRSFADVIFCYGPYSKVKMDFFAPSYSVGHPSFSFINEAESLDLKIKLDVDKNKKTILYCPTWGDLSSFEVFISTIMQLHHKYNILLKLHHNTLALHKELVLLDSSEISLANEFDIDKLIQISDLVISDYSGAIFDAIYANKSVILLQSLDFISENHSKVSSESLEISRCNEIGLVVKNPHHLDDAIQALLNKPFKYNALKEELFYNEMGQDFAGVKIILNDILNEKIRKHQGQKFINNIVVDERIKTFKIKKMEKRS